MKKKITTLFLLALGVSGAYAQDGIGVGIGTPLPNKGAMLDVTSTSKGVLIPRVKLSDSKTWGLDGGATESMLVYNETAAGDMKVGFYYWSKAIGTPAVAGWELITSQTELTKHLTDVRNEFKTQIDNITNIGGTDNSYLVAFDPNDKTAAETTGTFTYLIAKKDADGKITGYDKKKITFKDMISGSETNTFFKEKTVQVKDPNDPTKEIKTLVGYYYFSEKAISDWVSV
ncbi:MAG: hypothetical protein LBE34_00590, partial [Flavobacteriaceae bacterium]|nr:hypothetical protein [Flavobacteriaceae bacterium]